jgi:L-lysine exporter family protein LysE/ArgO
VEFSSSALPAALGLLTGLSLIVAIGAQNAFVLKSGIEGHVRTVLPIVLVCALSDAVLILSGVAGIGALVQGAPVALLIIRIVGATFLIGYGLLAVRRVFHPHELDANAGKAAPSVRVATLTAIALTWLNPHVYLDTLLLLGSIANRQGANERWWFAAGAILASFLWFGALGFGARFLRPIFVRRRSWQILDAGIAVVMITIGIRIAVGL